VFRVDPVFDTRVCSIDC